MLFLSGQPFTVNIMNNNTPSGTLSSFALIHNLTDHQLKDGLENKSINVSASSLRDQWTWNMGSPIMGPGSPHLSVQRLTLMIATLSLMSPPNWPCDSEFIAQVKSVEAKWKGNVKGRAAFCLKCHCPFMSPQPSKSESGSGEGGAITAAFSSDKVLEKVKEDSRMLSASVTFRSSILISCLVH